MDPRLQRHELGFLELVDKPSKEELADYYERNYYQNESGSYRKTYSELELKAVRSRVMRHARQLSKLRVGGTGSLLDVGCGEGFVLSYYAKQGWEVKGLDFSRAGIEIMNPDILQYVKLGDVFESLNDEIRKKKKYDLVWLGNVLEHVLEPIDLLQQLREIVVENGILVVTVPNDGNAYHESLFDDGLIKNRFWIAIPDHISYFTKNSLKRVAEVTGWQCLSFYGDFPVDWFIANDFSNYINDKNRGATAHNARLRLEAFIDQEGPDNAMRFYESLADVNLGRNITAYMRPNT